MGDDTKLKSGAPSFADIQNSFQNQMNRAVQAMDVDFSPLTNLIQRWDEREEEKLQLLKDKQAVYIFVDQSKNITNVEVKIPEEVAEQILVTLQELLKERGVPQAERNGIIDSLKNLFVISGGIVSISDLLLKITDAILTIKGLK